MTYLLALDQGTSSTRSIVFDRQGRIVGLAQREFTQYYPRPGWVEHDPLEIWQTQRDTMGEAIHRAGVAARDIRAIGITNQRETTVVWDRRTGEPVHPAIVWQDRRAEPTCADLRAQGLEPEILNRTGLRIDAYFSATKLKWILDHVPGARARALAGELLFGTIDSWLVWNLSGGQAHVTDYSNAARTLLFNIHTLDWDDDLLALLDILPTVSMWEGMNASRAMQVYHWTFLAQPEPIPENLLKADPVGWLDHTIASWSRAKKLDLFDPLAMQSYAESFSDPSRIHAACMELPAFQKAAPQNQIDAE